MAMIAVCPESKAIRMRQKTLITQIFRLRNMILRNYMVELNSSLYCDSRRTRVKIKI